MLKIPIRDYTNDSEIIDHVVVEENPELRLKGLLDYSSKLMMLSTVHLGIEKHFLFPVIKMESLVSDSLYVTFRHVIELPASTVKAVFLHTGLVMIAGGVKKLIWRERCVLQNTVKEVYLDIPMSTRMDSIEG